MLRVACGDLFRLFAGQVRLRPMFCVPCVHRVVVGRNPFVSEALSLQCARDEIADGGGRDPTHQTASKRKPMEIEATESEHATHWHSVHDLTGKAVDRCR